MPASPLVDAPRVQPLTGSELLALVEAEIISAQESRSLLFFGLQLGSLQEGRHGGRKRWPIPPEPEHRNVI
jgi:hypothetical protein